MSKINNKMHKLAILTANPIQYQTPLFKRLAQHPQIDLTVYFCWDFGVKKASFDAGFGKEIKWDIPLLDGYKYKFLPNISLRPSEKFFGQINPSIVKEFFSHRYDAIWVHGYASFTNWLTFAAAWLSRTPILLRGESHLLNYRPRWKRFIKNILLRLLFRRISGFLAIGSLNREYYQHYGVPDTKIFHAPYTIDDDFFIQQSAKWKNYQAQTRKELGINKNSVVILYTGKIFGKKGPGAFDLLKAYEKLISNFQFPRPPCFARRSGRAISNTALVFVGDGKEKPILEEYAKQRKIKNVIFTGFKNQTEIPKYYSAADIFVLPSHSEQWGVVLNEALHFNLAIIASDKVGAAYDLVRPGKNGYRYPAGDIHTLTDCFKKILSNRKLLQSMKTESKKIIQNWRMENCIAGVLMALRRLNS